MDFIQKKIPSKMLRFCAKLIDYMLIYLLGELSVLFLSSDLEPLCYLAGVILLPIISIPYETLSLYAFETTLGRAVFGQTIHEEQKEQLSFKGAFRASLFFLRRPKSLSYFVTRKGRSQLLAALTSILLACALTVGQLMVPNFRGTHIPETTQGWIHYVGSTGNFSVDFPIDPQSEAKKLFIPQASRSLDLHEYISKVSDDLNYTVRYVLLPRSWGLAGSNTILNITMEVLYEKGEGKEVISKQFVKHWGRTPALDFEVKEGEKKYKGRFIVSGRKLIQVVMEYPSSVEQSVPISDTFIESLNINGR
jgi:hypothetical protein